jgi:transcriptional regulator with XRE-family HTH domain
VITKNKLINELKNKQYRDAFVSAHVDIGIPHQIRILREQREWTQQKLADRTGWKQAWIAKIENPNYTGFSLKTLKKLASAFDVAVIVRFVPISNLVKWELEISPESLQAVSFEKDPYFKEISQEKRSVANVALASFLLPKDPLDRKTEPWMPRNVEPSVIAISQSKIRPFEGAAFRERKPIGIEKGIAEARL